MYIPYERKRYASNSSPKSEGVFIINKFAGGLNNTESDTLINDDQSVDNLNMSFLSGENMKKRYGTSLLLKSEIIYDSTKVIVREPIEDYPCYCVLCDTNIFPYKESRIDFVVIYNDIEHVYSLYSDYDYEDAYRYISSDKTVAVEYNQKLQCTVMLFKNITFETDTLIVYPDNDADLFKILANPVSNKLYTDVGEEVFINSPITFMSEETYTVFETDSVSGNYKNYKRLLFATDTNFYVYDMNTEKIILIFGVNGRVRGTRFNNVFFFVDGEELYAYYDTASQMYYNDTKIEGVRTVITDPKFFIQEKQVLLNQLSTIDLNGNGYTLSKKTVPSWQLKNDLSTLNITYTKRGEGEKYDVMNSYAITGSLSKDSIVYEFDRIETNNALDSGYYVVDYTTSNDTFYYWKNNVMTDSFVGYSNKADKGVTIYIKDCVTYNGEVYIPRNFSDGIVYQKLNGSTAVTLVDTVLGEELNNVYIKTSPVTNTWIRILELGTVENAISKGDAEVTVYVNSGGEVVNPCNYIYVSDRPLGSSKNRIDLMPEFATVPEYVVDPSRQLVLTYRTTEKNEAGNEVIVWKQFSPDVKYAVDTITWEDSYSGQRRTKIITPIEGMNETFKSLVEGSDGSTVLRTYIPNDISYTGGNMVITDKYVWYEPCMNELEDTMAGENFLPNKPTNVSVHNGQLCVCGDTEGNNVLFMSHQGNPYYFPASHTFVLESTGDGIVDFFEFDTALIVGRHKDIWVIYGEGVYSDNNPYRLSKVDAHTGFACAGCGALINNYYIYLGYDGRFYRMNTPTTYTEYLMTRPLTNDIDITRKPLSIDTSNLRCLSPVVRNNEVWFSFDADEPIVIVYSFDNMAFTYYKGMNSSYLYSNDIDVYIGRKDGIITKYDKTCYSDLYHGYPCKFITKRFDFDSPANFKYFKQVKLTLSTPDGIYTSVYLKSIADSYVTEFVNAVESGIVFGSAQWGQVFFNADVYHSQWKQISNRGRNIQFELYNNSVNQPMCVFEISVPYTIRDIR